MLPWLITQQLTDVPAAALPPVQDLIGPGSAVGLLLAVVWMILTDRLVPGRRVARIEQEWASRVSNLEQDRDYWRTLALRLLGQHDRLLNAAEVSAQALSALPTVTESGDRG
jgi:hypothetical protein